MGRSPSDLIADSCNLESAILTRMLTLSCIKSQPINVLVDHYPGWGLIFAFSMDASSCVFSRLGFSALRRIRSAAGGDAAARAAQPPRLAAHAHHHDRGRHAGRRRGGGRPLARAHSRGRRPPSREWVPGCSRPASRRPRRASREKLTSSTTRGATYSGAAALPAAAAFNGPQREAGAN